MTTGVALLLTLLLSPISGPWAGLPQEEQLARIAAAADRNAPLVLQPGVSVGPITLGMSREAVRELLGEPRLRLDADTWSYSLLGLAVVFDEDGVTTIFGGGDPAVHEPLVRAFKGRTLDGIGIGSTLAQVTRVLGRPGGVAEQPEGHRVSLRYRHRGIDLALVDDRVSWVAIYPPRVRVGDLP